MSKIFYHWAPKRLRETILRNGLQIMSEARMKDRQPDGSAVKFPWLCLATRPSRAWGLVLDKEEEHPDNGGQGWDLWEVRLMEEDHINFIADWGPEIREVRVHNSVPADRVWWTGERNVYPHD